MNSSTHDFPTFPLERAYKNIMMKRDTKKEIADRISKRVFPSVEAKVWERYSKEQLAWICAAGMMWYSDEHLAEVHGEVLKLPVDGLQTVNDICRALVGPIPKGGARLEGPSMKIAMCLMYRAAPPIEGRFSAMIEYCVEEAPEALTRETAMDLLVSARLATCTSAALTDVSMPRK